MVYSLGAVVQQQTVRHTTEYLMDLSAQPSGVYYLRCKTGTGVAMMPVILLDH